MLREENMQPKFKISGNLWSWQIEIQTQKWIVEAKFYFNFMS